MKNKIKYILTVVLILLVGIGVYKGVNLYTEHIETLEREAELELIRNEIRDRIRYANWMFFQNNFLYYDMHDDFFSTMDIYDSFFGGRVNISEVIFVHSAEEAEGFAEDVFVAWPTEGSEMFLELINDWLDPEVIGMLQHIDNTRITIDDLNVELPLKQELMVKDWEMMNEIMGRLSNENSITGINADRSLRGTAERRIREEIRREEEETIEDR